MFINNPMRSIVSKLLNSLYPNAKMLFNLYGNDTIDFRNIHVDVLNMDVLCDLIDYRLCDLNIKNLKCNKLMFDATFTKTYTFENADIDTVYISGVPNNKLNRTYLKKCTIGKLHTQEDYILILYKQYKSSIMDHRYKIKHGDSQLETKRHKFHLMKCPSNLRYMQTISI